MLSQEGHPIAFYSEKLNDNKKKYSPYALELYIVVQTLHHWRHYLFGTQFVLFSDHEALHVQSQLKLSAHRARWSTYLKEFTFVIQHKAGKENQVAGALSSHKHFLVTYMYIIVPGCEEIRHECP